MGCIAKEKFISKQNLSVVFGLNKIKEAREKAKEIKEKLDNTFVHAESNNGEVRVECTGGRKVVSIKLNESIYRVREQSEVEQLVLDTVNMALAKADQLAETEMRAIMPNIPGM